MFSLGIWFLIILIFWNSKINQTNLHLSNLQPIKLSQFVCAHFELRQME